MSEKQVAYLQIHFCVLLWGFTAVLGKLITLDTLPLIFWRVVLCCVLLPWLIVWSGQWRVLRRVVGNMLGVGVLVALHWMCFYGSVKLANASVAVAAISSTSFFAAFAEPLLFGRKIQWYEVGLGALVLPGMLLVAGSLPSDKMLGFGVGIAGGLLGALFSSFNKKIIEQDRPPSLLMSFTELVGVGITVAVAIIMLQFYGIKQPFFPESRENWAWLLLFAWGCTVLPFSLSLHAMRHLSAFSINLTLNLEPIYGILLAGCMLHEHLDLSLQFYVGALIIFISVFSHPFLKKKWHDA